MEKKRGGKKTTNKRYRRKEKESKRKERREEKEKEWRKRKTRQPPPTTHHPPLPREFLIHISQLVQKKTSYTKNAEIKHKITKPSANYIFYQEYTHHVQSK